MNFQFTIEQNPLEIQFDAESINEGLKVLLDNESEISRAFDQFSGDSDDESDEQDSGDDKPKKRRRRTKAQKAADDAAEAAAPPVPIEPVEPVTASAPPPVPVPSDGTVAPEIAIPPALQRTAAPPPPPEPVAAPVETLGAKVIDYLKKRAVDDAAKTKWAEWLAASDIVVKGATFDESLAVLQFTDDDKIAPIATALGVQ